MSEQEKCAQATNKIFRLAMVQIKLLIAMLFHQFSMRMDSAYPEDDMEELQLAVLAPKGGRCMMEFSRLG
jgi:hypothetical protein